MTERSSTPVNSCQVDQCDFLNNRFDGDKTMTHACHLFAPTLVRKELISADRGDLNTGACPMEAFLELDPETRQTIAQDSLSLLGVIAKVVNAGGEL